MSGRDSPTGSCKSAGSRAWTSCRRWAATRGRLARRRPGLHTNADLIFDRLGPRAVGPIAFLRPRAAPLPCSNVADAVGQTVARRAFEVVAAGEHNLLTLWSQPRCRSRRSAGISSRANATARLHDPTADLGSLRTTSQLPRGSRICEAASAGWTVASTPETTLPGQEGRLTVRRADGILGWSDIPRRGGLGPPVVQSGALDGDRVHLPPIGMLTVSRSPLAESPPGACDLGRAERASRGKPLNIVPRSRLGEQESAACFRNSLRRLAVPWYRP